MTNETTQKCLVTFISRNTQRTDSPVKQLRITALTDNEELKSKKC